MKDPDSRCSYMYCSVLGKRPLRAVGKCPCTREVNAATIIQITHAIYIPMRAEVASYVTYRGFTIIHVQLLLPYCNISKNFP